MPVEQSANKQEKKKFPNRIWNEREFLLFHLCRFLPTYFYFVHLLFVPILPLKSIFFIFLTHSSLLLLAVIMICRNQSLSDYFPQQHQKRMVVRWKFASDAIKKSALCCFPGFFVLFAACINFFISQIAL